jgi:tripartite-type tricarboxylate transporter receptor subunit TctC
VKLFLSLYRQIFPLGMALGIGFLLFGQALAQEVFPSRPIEFVVPLPPGGVADMHARALAPLMEQILKQPVLIINKPGSVSKVGTQYALTTKPDGYTILLAMPSFFSAPEEDRLFGRKLAYEREQFTPVARLSADPLLMYIRASSPWKSISDFVADAKRRPGQITYVSSGMWSSLHLLMEIFSAKAGIKLLHVPYKGGGAAITAILGGHGDMLANTAPVGYAHVKGGALRVLASTGGQREEKMPEVPTLKELQYDIEFYLPVSIVVRKETPQKTIQVLAEAIGKAAKSPPFISAMAKLGTPVAFLGGEDLKKFWKWETEVMIQAVNSAWKTK